MKTLFAIVALALPILAAARGAPPASADELLAADRAFAAAAAKTDVVSAIDAMLADDAVMIAPGGKLASGRAQIDEALNANPDNAKSKIDWSPQRAGVSADGTHGFTFGFQKITKPDGAVAAAKYLAYWVRQPAGWRVAAYKRRPAPGGQRAETMAPALAKSAPGASDAAKLASFEKSIAAAELAFSDEAQKIGLGPAFAKFGSTDAVNMGGPQEVEFVRGPESIAKLVAQGETGGKSSVSWSADKVRVAPSGDLGVTIGTIRENEPTADGKPARSFAFFTVWRRDDAKADWRYIAE